MHVHTRHPTSLAVTGLTARHPSRLALGDPPDGPTRRMLLKRIWEDNQRAAAKRAGRR